MVGFLSNNSQVKSHILSLFLALGRGLQSEQNNVQETKGASDGGLDLTMSDMVVPDSLSGGGGTMFMSRMGVVNIGDLLEEVQMLRNVVANKEYLGTSRDVMSRTAAETWTADVTCGNSQISREAAKDKSVGMQGLMKGESENQNAKFADQFETDLPVEGDPNTNDDVVDVYFFMN
ncbi:hypothetical protein DCAR_0728082 [Daucus carota subsp. sativus]|uniref:Uncharacterized protein n=1 Tax=Daucus carota subsp. sativus TaxID=79200 RepID=A0A161X3Z2_DAUCS|nr:hypothetical protein DCAR_0728082 [Daucus carota subsp. sativus]